MTNDRELRERCILMAIQAAAGISDGKTILREAKIYYDFIIGDDSKSEVEK
jgi:hypothetical protein